MLLSLVVIFNLMIFFSVTLTINFKTLCKILCLQKIKFIILLQKGVQII